MWQLVTFVVVNLISVVVWGQLLKSDVRSLNEQMSTMRDTVQEIRRNMPNPDVINIRVQTVENQVRDYGERIRALETYNQNLRERLAANGWKSQ